MCGQVYLSFVLIVFFAAVHNGYTLTCWTCNSQSDITCRDPFDVERIKQNEKRLDNVVYESSQIQPVMNEPHLQQCDEKYNVNYNKKNVCLKMVHKGANGIPIVRRECRLVPASHPTGECPDDAKFNNAEFCGTCGADRCNLATGIKTNIFLASVVPTSLLLFLRT